MDATLGKLVQGTLLASEWAEIKRDLQARSKERNRLVHGFWMISDDFPNDLLLYNDQNRSMHKYTEADLMNTLDRIVATRRSCHALLDKIVEALRVGALTPSALGPIGVEL